MADNKRQVFSKSALGWASIIMGAALLLVFGYALFQVMPLLTNPPQFIDQTIRDELRDLAPKERPDLYVAYVATLEYESFVIRTQGIQVALGFLVGLLVAAFGMVLFAIGASDAFEASAEGNKATAT